MQLETQKDRCPAEIKVDLQGDDLQQQPEQLNQELPPPSTSHCMRDPILESIHILKVTNLECLRKLLGIPGKCATLL